MVHIFTFWCCLSRTVRPPEHKPPFLKRKVASPNLLSARRGGGVKQCEDHLIPLFPTGTGYHGANKTKAHVSLDKGVLVHQVSANAALQTHCTRLGVFLIRLPR